MMSNQNIVHSAFVDPVSGERFVPSVPANIQWTEIPDGMGVKMAVLSGDLAKEGLYVVRVTFPPGVMSRPHYHPEDRHALVIKGTWYQGLGDEFAPDKTFPLGPGSYIRHPAGGHHFDGAKGEEVVVQIVGYGPSNNVFIRPSEGGFGPSM